jgi:hypothetical protein
LLKEDFMTHLERERTYRTPLIAFLAVVVLVLCASGTRFGSFARYESAAAAQPASSQAYQELIELSQKEKKGLTFFVKGQTIAGIVVKSIGTEAVEVRSQTYSRVVIRLESVDAVAMN